MPINIYDEKSAGAESYRQLAKEVICRGLSEEEIKKLNLKDKIIKEETEKKKSKGLFRRKAK